MNHELLHCEVHSEGSMPGEGIRFYCRCGWVNPPNEKHHAVNFLDHLHKLNEPRLVVEMRDDRHRHWWQRW